VVPPDPLRGITFLRTRRTGRLAVSRREGFQKVYDLTERVIPAAYRSERPSRAQSVDWACRSALDRLGVATAGELAAFWGAIPPREAAAWAAAQADEAVKTFEETLGKLGRSE